MNKDLTHGKPEKVLWSFCLPLFGSIIFQQLYNIADSLIAGKFIGENALAAVGNSYEITLIFIAFAFGCNIGCSVITSRFFGAQEYKNVKTAVYTTFISGAVLCITLMCFGFLCCNTLLSIIHTPTDIFANSKLYLLIYMAGLPFLFFYNISTGIFSALGDSKTPFWFLAFSSTANILADYIFVKFLNMGIAGVAWATFLCQGISSILAVIFILKRLRKLPGDQKGKLFSITIFKQICIIAIPSILQQSFISVGNIIIQGIINGFGSSVIAGYAAAIKLNNLVITSFTTLGNGISNFTSQNLGAGKMERIHQGLKAGIKLVWILCIPIVILYLTGGKWIIYLFMDHPKGLAMDTGIEILRILSPFYFITALKLVTDGVLRGLGKMKAFMTATLTDLTLRVILAWILSIPFGALGIWCAWPIGWSVATVLSLLFYKKVQKSI